MARSYFDDFLTIFGGGDLECGLAKIWRDFSELSNERCRFFDEDLTSSYFSMESVKILTKKRPVLIFFVKRIHSHEEDVDE